MDTTQPRYAAGRRWSDRQDPGRVIEIIGRDSSRTPRILQVRTVVAGASGSTGRRINLSIDTLKRRFDLIPTEDQE
jgi:hypothetical protein